MTFKAFLRIAVLKSNAYWPFSQLNPMAYSLAIKRFVNACQHFPEIRSVYLRHALAAGQWTPGLSDIDLTVIIDGGVARAQEFAFLAAFWKRIGRLQRIFPMLGEIEVLSEAHLDSWTRFGIEGLGAVNWQLLHGEETIANTPGPVSARFAQEAFDFAFWFYLHNVARLFNQRVTPHHLVLQDLSRLKRKIGRCLAAVNGKDAVGGTAATDDSLDPADTLLAILEMLREGLRTSGFSPGSEQAPDSRQRWLLRQASGNGVTKVTVPLDAEFANCSEVIRSIYLGPHQQPFVILRETFTPVASRRCIHQVKRHFTAQDWPPVILTGELFAYLLRCFDPYNYAHFIRHATLAFGEPCLDEIAPPEEVALRHDLVRQAPLLLMLPQGQDFMSPGWQETGSPVALEFKLDQALALRLYLEHGIVKPSLAAMVAEYEARYPQQAEDIRKLRASLKHPKSPASSWAWFVFLRGVTDDIHAALLTNDD